MTHLEGKGKKALYDFLFLAWSVQKAHVFIATGVIA